MPHSSGSSPEYKDRFQFLEKCRSSDLTSRLRSNHAASASEISQISGLLAKGNAEVADYESEISKLKTTIFTLESQRDGVKRYMEGYRSLLSPIRKLPVELLTHIFTYRCLRNSPMHPDDIPALHLGMVCTHWHAITMSTPRLWSTIDINFDSHQKPRRMQQDLLDLLLKRSGDHPLTLTVRSSTFEFEKHQKAIMRSLVLHSERWLDVCFNFDVDVMFSSTLASVRNNLSMLEHLELVAPDEWLNEDEDAFGVFATAPELKHVCISNIPPSKLTVPWSQLTKLGIRGQGTSFAVQVLNLARGITSAYFEDCFLDGPPLDEPVHSELRSLTFGLDDGIAPGLVVLSSFISQITMPSLETMIITSYNESRMGPWPHDEVLLFLSRSACSLTKLSLENVAIPEANALALLRLLPSLTDLTIKELRPGSPGRSTHHTSLPIITDTFLGSMHPFFPNSLPTPLLPNLLHLRLTVQGRFSDSLFADMVKSRCLHDPTRAGGGLVRLESATLHVTERAFDPASLESLKALTETRTRVAVAGYGG